MENRKIHKRNNAIAAIIAAFALLAMTVCGGGLAEEQKQALPTARIRRTSSFAERGNDGEVQGGNVGIVLYGNENRRTACFERFGHRLPQRRYTCGQGYGHTNGDAERHAEDGNKHTNDTVLAVARTVFESLVANAVDV